MIKKLFLIFCIFTLSSCSRYEGSYLQGYIEGDYTYISSIVAGKLEKLFVDKGQTVTQGQKLFALELQPESAQVEQAAATLASEQSKLKDLMKGQRSTVLAGIIAQREQARAQLELATANFTRSSTLFQKGVLSKADFDNALAQLKSNQQRVHELEENLKEATLGEREYRVVEQTQVVKKAEADLAEAKWRVEQKIGIAPEAGFIYDTYFNIGEQVAANQAVVSLLTPENVYIVFYIPEPIRSKISVGDTIEFSCDGCDKRYLAQVSYLSSQAEYTPPIIYSRESRSKLVYLVEANLSTEAAKRFYPGQPIDIYLLKKPPKGNRFRKWLWNLTN